MKGGRENMRKFLSKIKDSIIGEEVPASQHEENEEGYVELDTAPESEIGSKVIVRSFTIEDFSDIKTVLDVLRNGTTIALVNIKPLKSKDLIELKRAINKLKKTCDAVEGDIAGFGDNWIVATPALAKIHRNKETENLPEAEE